MSKAVILKTKVGNGQLEVHADSFKEICDYSTLIGQMPKKCGKCGSENIYLYHKAPKGNDYYGLACGECGAEFNFHQKKEGGFYIRHDDEWSKFFEEGGQTAKPDDSGGGPENFKGDDPDNIPF